MTDRQFLELHFYDSGNPTILACRRIDAVERPDGDGSVIFLDGKAQGIKVREAYIDVRDLLVRA